MIFHFPEKLNTSIKTLSDGVLTSFLIYFICFLAVVQLDQLRMTFRKNSIPNPYKNLLLLSFTPLSASSIFQLVPAPYSILFFGFAFIYSLYLSSLSLRLYAKFQKKDYLAFLLYSGIFILFLALLITILFKAYAIYAANQNQS
ncbi:MAG: hypothetical protein AAF518_00790 [Spirochaetota bacterium]